MSAPRHPPHPRPAAAAARPSRVRGPWLHAGLLSLLAAATLSAQFVERAGPAGLDLLFPTEPGNRPGSGLDPFVVGSAAAACDLDGDGWTDLIVTRADGPCLVFLNNRDGTFREEAARWGLDGPTDIGGLAVGDLDNDGDPDVVMAPVFGPRYFLFINDGAGRFHEAAVERGADATVTAEPHRGQSISLVDYDRDGYLDLQFSEWRTPQSSENERHSPLLHNRGAAAPGFFENRTAATGTVQPVLLNISALFATGWADYDGDGLPDKFVAGDFGSNQIWWANPDGTFLHGTATSGIASSADGMGLALLDYDGDGRLDIFVSAIDIPGGSSLNTPFVSDNRLFRNLGNRQFLDVSLVTGVRESGWGWGAGTLDANNDGRPDLVVTNGYLGPGEGFAAARNDATRLFLNRGGTFSSEGFGLGLTDTGLGRAAVILDYDHDGRQDIFLTQTQGHRLLYRNTTPATGAHWLRLRFLGTTSNRDGYGCEVTVTAGGRSQVAVYNPTNSYLGQHEPRLHFGLGAATTAEHVVIRWPGGLRQEFTNVAADQTLLAVEAAGVFAAPAAAPALVAEPRDALVLAGAPALLTATVQAPLAATYRWRKDGVPLPGADAPSLRLAAVAPADAGLYTLEATNPAGTATSRAVIVAPTLPADTRTAGPVVLAPNGANIRHPNGNLFDQFLLTGPAASLASDPAKITRLSYLDLNGDIVQVEFSGPGTLTILLENPAGPAPPAKYRQPDIAYLQGHARIFFVGTDARSNLSIFTVGRLTAFDPTGAWDIARPASETNNPLANANPLFIPGMDYDGVADLAALALASTDGAFGGLRAGDAAFFASAGRTGVFAPDVAFAGPVVLHDITAFTDATPVLETGAVAGGSVVIAGGSLEQANQRALQIGGLARLLFRDGTDAHARRLPAQVNGARIERAGVDVTAAVAGPTP